MLVCCMGMPRAASTLQYNIAAGLVEKTNSGRRLGFYNVRSLSYFQRRKLLHCKDDSRLYVIKSHHALPDEFAQDEGSLRTLYSFRDLRSVAQSMKRIFDVSGETLLMRIRIAVLEERKISESGLVLNMSFEELTTDLPTSIRKTANFLGIDVGDKLVMQLASDLDVNRIGKEYQSLTSRPINRLKALAWGLNSTFRLGKVARRLGLSQATRNILKRPFYMYDSRTLFHSAHVSPHKGGAELSDWERDMIETEFGDWLAQKGYM